MTRTAKTGSKAAPTQPSDEEQPAIYSVHLIKSILLLTVLASTSLATQLALHPLYGSTTTSINHSKVELLACLLSALFPLKPNVSERITLLGLASWLGYAPYASYAIGKWTTQWRNPVLGPAVAEVAILLPAVSVGIALGRRWSSRFLSFLPGPMSLKAVGAIGTFNVLRVLEQWLWAHLPLGGQIHSSNIFFANAGLLTLVAAALSPAQESSSNVKSGISTRLFKMAFPFFLPIVVVLAALSLPPISSPRTPYTRRVALPRASSTAVPPATVRVLASTHSVSGLLLVGEYVEQGFRFLRNDHALLGGRWVGKQVAPGSRDGLGDSIYSSFVLQEAVRLVEREKTTDERALVIGLGVGVAAEALITHKVNTTVVEIDPGVYDYARKYFSLPEPTQIYFKDAREWVHERASPAAEDKYDYVIHDCFSGGGVPGHIYTLEFWEELKGLVKSDGVIAVNFAGSLASDPARAIFLTLQKSFGRCRAFHDHLEAEFDESYTFFNVVFFCMPLSSSMPPTFRSASKADYLSSHLRRHVLGAFLRREVEPSRILGMDETPEGKEKWILRDGTNRLEEWHQPDAAEHWTVMRAVLPDIFWETY